MKLIRIIMVTLALALFGTVTPQNVNAEPPPVAVNITDTLARFSHSIFYVNLFKAPYPMRIGKGSCVCIQKTAKTTMFVTAGHVVEGIGYMILYVYDKKYTITSWKVIPSTDAAYFIVEESIKEAIPLEFNLSLENQEIPVIALGMWYSTEKLSGTFGSVSRKPTFFVMSSKQKMIRKNAVILGNLPILAGFSGGALIDLNGKFVGINCAIGDKSSMYIDSRYVWNNIPELSGGKSIPFKLDDTVNILEMDGWERIAPKYNDIFINDGKAVLIKDAKPKDVSFNTQIVLSGKKYGIVYAQIRSDADGEVVISNNLGANGKYLYLGDNGWAIRIHLAELPTK